MFCNQSSSYLCHGCKFVRVRGYPPDLSVERVDGLRLEDARASDYVIPVRARVEVSATTRRARRKIAGSI